MTEGDPTRPDDIKVAVPIRPKYVLAPESIPAQPESEEITVFSAKQFDRLNTFRNLIAIGKESERDELENGHPLLFGRAKNGKVTSPYMTLDSKFRATVYQTAWRLYADELSQDPGMKEAADSIVEDLKEAYDDPPALTPEEAEDLFNR